MTRNLQHTQFYETTAAATGNPKLNFILQGALHNKFQHPCHNDRLKSLKPQLNQNIEIHFFSRQHHIKLLPAR
jgi:hypothetical protein